MSNPEAGKHKCKRCNSTDFETNDQGFTCCSNCGLLEDQTKFDNNVVFGEQRDLQGKNINKQGNLSLTQRNSISFPARKDSKGLPTKLRTW